MSSGSEDVQLEAFQNRRGSDSRGDGKQQAREPRDKPGSRARPLRVSEVVRGVRSVIDRNLGYDIWLVGETSSMSRPASGHVYFSLSDRHSQIAAIMYRGDAQRLRFQLENGQTLHCLGRPTVYQRTGRMQFQIVRAEPAGLGADALALEQLKRKLAAEGLFERERKRPLPLLPLRIGVVTSASGAAVRDIIRTVQRRFPVPILLADASVQGDEAPAQIAAAVAALGRTDVDVVIVGRGGGAASDLAAFNHELVVRAVAACPVPTISAVGHEVDISLTDLVADHRAATPTAAGELAVPVLADLAVALAKEERRLHHEMVRTIQDTRQELDQQQAQAQAQAERAIGRGREALYELQGRLEGCHPSARLSARRSELESLAQRMQVALERRLELAEARMHELEQRLHVGIGRRIDTFRAEFSAALTGLRALSPLAVLERGYSIATTRVGALTDAKQVGVGTRFHLRLAHGSLDCAVEAVHKPKGDSKGSR